MRRQKSRSSRKQKLNPFGSSPYEKLEPRNLLAAYFPTYVNGEFTLGLGPESATPYELADTFSLATHPNAKKTIYLDYTGFHSVNNDWDHDIVFPAFDRDGDASSFSDAELLEIQLQFQNVAEDFAPFNVNVTTIEPDIEKLRKTEGNDQEYGIRSVNTQATDGFGGFGGIAFLNSFNDAIDNPVFALNKGENNGGMTNSHEVGHALGLRHDGLGGAAYHPGVGTGETSWGPIMGAPFGTNVTQWSEGDYVNSTNTEDDFPIIVSQANGFGFVPDDYGNTSAEASKLTAVDTNVVFDTGIVGQNSDVDFFRFKKGFGNVAISVKAFALRPNLDVLARIYDANGNLVAEENPSESVNSTFDLSLPAGEYFLSVEGIGKTGVYSDYGSVGFYTIEGLIENLVADLPIGEVGRVFDLDHNWQTVQLTETYLDPVVIAGPLSYVGGDPSVARIRNVTETSFEIRLQEWDYRDGKHTREIVDYLVVESGEYILEDGTIIIAKNEPTQTHRWKSYGLGDTFRDNQQDPIVFAQVVSNNDAAAVTTRIRNVTATDFQIKIQEEQANTRTAHGQETVSWIAIQQNVGEIGELTYETDTTPNAVTHKSYDLDFNHDFGVRPGFFAKMQTFNGGDPAAIRYKEVGPDSATIFLQEERSLDVEVRHNPEVVGYWAIETGLIVGSSAESPFAYKSGSKTGNWQLLKQLAKWGETSMPFAEPPNQDGHGAFKANANENLGNRFNKTVKNQIKTNDKQTATEIRIEANTLSDLASSIDSVLDIDLLSRELFAIEQQEPVGVSAHDLDKFATFELEFE